MKLTHIALFSLALFSLPALAGGHCAKKEAEIEKQISYAKEHNNSHRVRGLETALAEVRAHCTEAGEIKKQQDSRDELANKIRGKQDDIRELREELAEDRAELKADIAEAERKGKVDKVAKYQRELAEEEAKTAAKISAKEAEIRALKSELDAR
ncbi:MAG: DUF1090 domain-containing protein [Shewanella algae]